MIERLDELNRVLDAALTLQTSGPDVDIPLDSVLRLCRRAVRRGLLPAHERTIEFASKLGLLECLNETVRVTNEGILFMSLNPELQYELTQEQAKMLARRYYLSGPYAEDCRRILNQFNATNEPGKLVWSEIDDPAFDADPQLASHLCQLGLIMKTNGGYETIPSTNGAILGFLDERKGLTEGQLRELLLEKELVGAIGEELALAFERTRLLDAQCMIEAHCVRCISQTRVNAGYDIESFNGESKTGAFDRFIEVKASRGKEIRFYWSENEMAVARSLGDRYWIYFFGNVDIDSKTTDQEPVLLQNPIESVINNDKFIKRTEGILVQTKSLEANREY